MGELYQKMVVEERGGWCCELNGLFCWLLQVVMSNIEFFKLIDTFFCWLLQAIGFTVRQVSASYYMEDKQKYKEKFDHLALIVTISEQVKPRILYSSKSKTTSMIRSTWWTWVGVRQISLWLQSGSYPFYQKS